MTIDQRDEALELIQRIRDILERYPWVADKVEIDREKLVEDVGEDEAQRIIEVENNLISSQNEKG